MIKGLSHIGVAVKSIDESIKFYKDALEFEHELTEEIETQKVRVSMLQKAGVHIELIEPTSPDSAIAKFLEKKGEGIQHIAFEVDDIRDELARLKQKGAKLIDETPRVGAGSKLIAFVHPSSTSGVLIEFTQTLKEN